MSGADFKEEIQSSMDPQEQVEDCVYMIDALAEARSSAPDEAEYELCAKFLCFLRDPWKREAFSYQEGLLSVRRRFLGIAGDPGLQTEYRKAMTPALLRLETVQMAVLLGPEKLFNFEGKEPPEAALERPDQGAPPEESEPERDVELAGGPPRVVEVD